MRGPSFVAVCCLSCVIGCEGEEITSPPHKPKATESALVSTKSKDLADYTPRKSIYTGDEVPPHFLRAMNRVGALDDEEAVLFFFSDESDMREDFTFVSDKRFVSYTVHCKGSPCLEIIPYSDISAVRLDRKKESTSGESQIWLSYGGGLTGFWVSTENDRDILFTKAIEHRIK